MDDPIFPQPTLFEGKITPLLGSYFYNELISEIEKSKMSIRSIQYQWKWNIHQRFSKVQMLGAAIIRAKKRNIKVEIILNQETQRKHITKINSITNDQLSRAGCAVRMLKTPSLLHTKMWIIDSQIVFIGSHNISTRALTVNEEASVKIESKAVAEFMNKYFDNLWGSR